MKHEPSMRGGVGKIWWLTQSVPPPLLEALKSGSNTSLAISLLDLQDLRHRDIQIATMLELRRVKPQLLKPELPNNGVTILGTNVGDDRTNVGTGLY